MYAVSLSINVNPVGVSPVLTRDEVWAGLASKAENAVPFVVGMTRCEIAERLPQGFWRNVEYNGQSLRERVTLTAPVQVLFEREPHTPDAGWITNVISNHGDDLILTFTFAVRFPGVAEGSEAERAQGDARCLPSRGNQHPRYRPATRGHAPVMAAARRSWRQRGRHQCDL